MEALIDKFVREVSQVQNSLKVASPWVKGEVLEELIKALKPQVKLEVILRAGERRDLEITDYRVFKAIRDFGGEVYINPRLHAKFLIMDERKAYVGSANLTYSGTVEGNLEAMVLVEEEEKVKELLALWELLKGSSVKLDKNTVAVALRAYSSTELEVLLLEDLPEESFLKVNTDKGFLVCKLRNISTLGPDSLSLKLSSFQKDWVVALINSMAEESGRIKVGKVHVVCEYIRHREKEKESLFGVPLKTLEVGTQFVRMEEEEELKELMGTNMSGYPMEVKVFAVGSLAWAHPPTWTLQRSPPCTWQCLAPQVLGRPPL